MNTHVSTSSAELTTQAGKPGSFRCCREAVTGQVRAEDRGDWENHKFKFIAKNSHCFQCRWVKKSVIRTAYNHCCSWGINAGYGPVSSKAINSSTLFCSLLNYRLASGGPKRQRACQNMTCGIKILIPRKVVDSPTLDTLNIWLYRVLDHLV